MLSPGTRVPFVQGSTRCTPLYPAVSSSPPVAGVPVTGSQGLCSRSPCGGLRLRHCLRRAPFTHHAGTVSAPVARRKLSGLWWRVCGAGREKNMTDLGFLSLVKDPGGLSYLFFLFNIYVSLKPLYVVVWDGGKPGKVTILTHFKCTVQ